jgi:hypothetical protein
MVHVIDFVVKCWAGDMNYRCTFSKKTPLDLTVTEQPKQKSTQKLSKKAADAAKAADDDDDDERSGARSEVDSDAEDRKVVDNDRSEQNRTITRMTRSPQRDYSMVMVMRWVLIWRCRLSCVQGWRDE